jgi:hypothetical protein
MYSSHDTEGTTSVLNISVKWRMDKSLFQSIKQGSLVWDVRLSQQCCLGFWSSEVWHYSDEWMATDTCGAFIFLSLKAKAPNLFKMWGTNSPYNTASHPRIPEVLGNTDKKATLPTAKPLNHNYNISLLS